MNDLRRTELLEYLEDLIARDDFLSRENGTSYTEIERSTLQGLYYSYMPFCVVIGFIGNCMVWVLIRSNRILSRLPSNTYLLCLSAMSSLFLSTLFLFWIEQDFMKVAYFNSTLLGCKALNFLAHFCDFVSVWLIALVGMERLILLHRKVRTLSVDRARMHILLLIVVAILFNACILFIAYPINGECDIHPEYEGLYDFFVTFETLFCILLPSLIIIISNVLVVIKLQAHLKTIPSSPTVSFHPMALSTVNSGTYNKTTTSRFSIGSHYVCLHPQQPLFKEDHHSTATQVTLKLPEAKKKPMGLRYTDIQLTRSLLIVTWMFILLNLPNYVIRIAQSMLQPVLKSNPDLNWYMEDCVLLAHLLLYTHHAFVFYLYIFYSPQMKRRLKPTALKLLECYCFKPDLSLDYNN